MTLLFVQTIVSPIFTIAHFYINQEQIADTFCENKNKPELNCKGQCYLTKKLSDKIEKNKTTDSKELNVSMFLPIAFNNIESINIEHPKLIKNNNSHYSNQYQFLVLNIFLDPPQL